MEAVAKLNNTRSSARKMRLVADLIRNVDVDEAITILQHTQKKVSRDLEKLLLSAISNWQQKNEGAAIDDYKLYVKNIYVDDGPILKRFQPAAFGRANKIRKRMSHVTVIIDSREEVELPDLEEGEGEKQTDQEQEQEPEESQAQ